ncbi:hypothetical protein N9915_02275 [Akkermansiaceae bacterium]|nr:hypothetical protein [Akkermansiaceae bacterium]
MLVSNDGSGILFFKDPKIGGVHANDRASLIREFDKGFRTTEEEVSIHEGSLGLKKDWCAIVGDLSKNEERAGEHEVGEAREDHGASTVLILLLVGQSNKWVLSLFLHDRVV